MSAIYTAVATANGRDGKAVSSDGKLSVTLAMPVEMGGDGNGTNPEQLFAAGYAACFTSALKLVAARQKLDVSEASATAEVGLSPNGSGGFGLSVTMRVELPDEITEAQGKELLEATHQVCPYSNATRGNIPVDIVRE
jgi:osmotically inducible protein OsmC